MAQTESLQGRGRRILVSGAGGLLGRHIVAERRAAGDTVVALTRLARTAGDVVWDPVGGSLDPRSVSGFDAVIHLAGEPVVGRWTAKKKRRIQDSRVKGTALLATALAAVERPPKVLLCASGINFYGNQGDRVVDESWPEGAGFLAGVSGEWEAACDPLRAVARVVNLRIGVVLARDGGTLPAMLPIFRLGLGGSIGGGCGYLSWVGVDDLVRGVAFLLDCELVNGPVNLVAPEPVTGREFTAELAAMVRRPAVVPVPGWLARLLLGEVAEETVLHSIRAVPRQLLDAGFRFRQDTLAKALAVCK